MRVKEEEYWEINDLLKVLDRKIMALGEDTAPKFIEEFSKFIREEPWVLKNKT